MNEDNSSKCHLGNSKIRWICHLCLSSFKSEVEWETHVQVHTLEELQHYKKSMFVILPNLEKELGLYEEIIEKGEKK